MQGNRNGRESHATGSASLNLTGQPSPILSWLDEINRTPPKTAVRPVGGDA